MALEPLATPADLAARLGVTVWTDPLVLAQVEANLADASAEIRAIVGQPITRMTSTVELYADRPCRVDLPAWPVVSIASVVRGGIEVDPTAYHVRFRTLRFSVCKGEAVTVTYTHGWEEIPGDLVLWTCVLAASMKSGTEATGALGLTAGVGTKSEAIDDYQVTLSGPESSGGDPATGLTLPESIATRLRNAYGGGGMAYWLEVEE